MRGIKIFIVLLCLIVHLPLYGQYSLKCDNVIFPACPGGGDGMNVLIINNNLKNLSVCDVNILQNATFGMVEYVGSGGNFETNDMYNYTTNSNCETEDRFLAVECCPDSTGVVVCDTIDYWIHLIFECQTPPDLFCCIPDDGQPIVFNVLENDADFIDLNYPDFQPSEVFIAGIVMQPANGTATVGPNFNQIRYTPPIDFTGVDSVVYEVEYYLQSPTETVRICDEQTAYIILEDCIQTVTDELTIALGDTIYFNALANDYIEPNIEHPNDTLPCQNPLPTIDASSFTLLASGPELNSLGDGDLCFSSFAGGCFSYGYKICSTAGVCATDTIIIKVDTSWDFCDPIIDLMDSPLYTNTIHAQNQIITSGTVLAGANVALKAGDCIQLNAGFQSNLSADLHISIEDCTPE